jgi:hypothetical protein
MIRKVKQTPQPPTDGINQQIGVKPRQLYDRPPRANVSVARADHPALPARIRFWYSGFKTD